MLVGPCAAPCSGCSAVHGRPFKYYLRYAFRVSLQLATDALARSRAVPIADLLRWAIRPSRRPRCVISERASPILSVLRVLLALARPLHAFCSSRLALANAPAALRSMSGYLNMTCAALLWCRYTMYPTPVPGLEKCSLQSRFAERFASPDVRAASFRTGPVQFCPF